MCQHVSNVNGSTEQHGEHMLMMLEACRLRHHTHVASVKDLGHMLPRKLLILFGNIQYMQCENTFTGLCMARLRECYGGLIIGAAI